MTCSNPNCELGCVPLSEEHDPSSTKYAEVHKLKGSGGGNSWAVTSVNGQTGMVTLTFNGQPVYMLEKLEKELKKEKE